MARVRKTAQLKQWYTTQEAAEILGVSAMTIYRWTQAGRLTATKIGDSKSAHLRITRASIEALLGEPIAAPVTIEEAPAPAPAPVATEPAAQHQQEAGSLADVFTALEALQHTIERAKANPHYCHVKGKINGVLEVLNNVSQELHKADDIADDLRKAYLGR